MKRIWGHVVSALAIGTVTSAFVPACATNDQSIFVRSVQAPPTTRQNNQCLYTPDPAQPILFSGSLDLAVRGGYDAVLMIGGQLVARGDPANARAESNRVHLEGAIVRVTKTDGSSITRADGSNAEFTSYGTGIVDPQTNNTPGFGLMAVTLIDGPTATALASTLPKYRDQVEVLAHVKAFGKTLGGVELESGEFQFPITVCNGCLVSFASGNDPLVQPSPNCTKPLEVSSGGGGTALPCNAGQDEFTPCQLCLPNPICANPSGG